jgi:DNA invertase Pin-like site-specific DNA recombinase
VIHSLNVHFTENESGASLHRPELFRLLEIAQKGDIVLVEQIDRISRLFKSIINSIKQFMDYYNTEFSMVSLSYTYNRLGMFKSDPL